ncbi:unnamed protein product [Caenorhabditis sp. 36 PRJEB53466]|nr:unnamed protein product [Caenorhabditis sp. 36 PRJEB53466]
MLSSPPSIFAIEALPELMQIEVLKNLTLHQLYRFSRGSRRCRQMVALMKHHVHIEIDLSYSGKTMRLVPTNGEQPLKWEFQTDVAANGSMYGAIGQPVPPRKPAAELLTAEHKMGIKLAHLIEAFRCPVRKFDFNGEAVNHWRSVFTRFRQCEELIVRGGRTDDACLQYILENIRVTRRFEIRYWTSRQVRCSNRIFNCDQLDLGNAPWMNREHLMGMKCATADISGVWFTKQDLADFVSKWYHSDDTRLQCVHFFLAVEMNDFELEEGIPTKSWDLRERGPVYRVSRHKKIDCRKGMDIERNDGLLATVISEERHFKFVVWHNRFPRIPDLSNAAPAQPRWPVWQGLW